MARVKLYKGYGELEGKLQIVSFIIIKWLVLVWTQVRKSYKKLMVIWLIAGQQTSLRTQLLPHWIWFITLFRLTKLGSSLLFLLLSFLPLPS